MLLFSFNFSSPSQLLWMSRKNTKVMSSIWKLSAADVGQTRHKPQTNFLRGSRAVSYVNKKVSKFVPQQRTTGCSVELGFSFVKLDTHFFFFSCKRQLQCCYKHFRYFGSKKENRMEVGGEQKKMKMYCIEKVLVLSIDLSHTVTWNKFSGHLSAHDRCLLVKNAHTVLWVRAIQKVKCLICSLLENKEPKKKPHTL